MKKTLILFTLLLATTCAWSQILIKPIFAKGDTVVYDNSVTSNTQPGQGNHQDITTRYIVDDINNEGYVIRINVLDYSGNTLPQTMGSEADIQQFLKNIDYRLQTDSTGNIKRIINYDEIAQKLEKKVNGYVDSMYNNNPEIFKATGKEKFKNIVKDTYSEDNLINLLKTNGMFAYYGKTLKTGYKEKQVVMGIKVDCTYDVIPSSDTFTIIRKDTVQMSDEDVKEFIIKMSGNSEAASNSENIEMVLSYLKALGGDLFKGTGTVTAHFLPNGWLNDQTIEQNFTIMRTEMFIRSRMRIKNKILNFKN